MSRFWHVVGSVLGTATTVVAALTPVLSGAPKAVVLGVGGTLMLVSNVFKALGKQ